jgi:hypothetical protein
VTWQVQAAIDLNRRGVSFRTVTSPATDTYNCIAWAANDTTQWWWPDGGYWPGPPGKKLAPTLQVFLSAFATQGFEQCNDPDIEAGFEKIALYGTNVEIKHAARQLPSGYWTSKLGNHVDVEHELAQVEGNSYGRVVAYLRRSVPPAQGAAAAPHAGGP